MDKVLLPFLFLAIAVGLYFSYIGPAYETLKAFQQQEVRLDDALAKSQNLKERREQLLDMYASIPDADLLRLKTILPDQFDVVRAIIEIDTLAKRNGLVVRSFSLPSDQDLSISESARATRIEESAVRTAYVTIDCVGPYDGFKNFLNALERNLSLVDVTYLNIRPEQKRRLVSGVDKATQEDPVYTLTLQSHWLPKQ